ncbi:MAG: hypothetical protein Q8R28_05400, partial [Dehalococcoidia bacterium]|nr:hypothetical protein [Dehalococcoidia bacterium]
PPQTRTDTPREGSYAKPPGSLPVQTPKPHNNYKPPATGNYAVPNKGGGPSYSAPPSASAGHGSNAGGSPTGFSSLP